MRTKLRKLTLTVLFLLLPVLAFASVQVYNGSNKNLGNYAQIKCGSGISCAENAGKLEIAGDGTASSVTGAEAGNASFTLAADESDDNGDDWIVRSNASGNALSFLNDTSGSAVAKFSLSTTGLATFQGVEAGDASITLQADDSDDNGDDWLISSHATNGFSISNDTSGSQVAKLILSTSGELSGIRSAVIAATATTITSAQCGSTFLSGGAIEMELPEASTVIGCTLMFVVGNASNFTVDPDGADIILLLTNAAGDSLIADAVGETLVIRAVSASQWVVVGSEKGTWTDSN